MGNAAREPLHRVRRTPLPRTPSDALAELVLPLLGRRQTGFQDHEVRSAGRRQGVCRKVVHEAAAPAGKRRSRHRADPWGRLQSVHPLARVRSAADGCQQRNKIKNYKSLWNGIKPFMGNARLSEITSQKLEAFRAWRIAESAKDSKRTLTEKTLHNDRILLSLVLKYAVRHQWLATMPLFPQHTNAVKHAHPEWFAPEQFETLLATSSERWSPAALDRVGNAREHVRKERMELHAFILFMAGGCIRVDECLNLRWADLSEHPDNAKVPPLKRQVLIHIQKGKTGERQGIGDANVLRAIDYLRQLHPNAKRATNCFGPRTSAA